MATVRNKTPRHKDYNLTQSIAAALGEGFSTATKVGQLVINPRTGAIGTTYVDKLIPASIHFNPRETKEIPDEALEIEEIKAALVKGDLARIG